MPIINAVLTWVLTWFLVLFVWSGFLSIFKKTGGCISSFFCTAIACVIWWFLFRGKLG